MVGTGAERILPGAIAQDPEGVVSSAISWASRTSVLIGDWMLAYNISGNAVTSLLKDVLPAASQGGLLPISALASDGRAVMACRGDQDVPTATPGGCDLVCKHLDAGIPQVGNGRALERH